MKFNLFGSTKNPVVVLIHGVLTPWQTLRTHAELFCSDYCVVVPALDGHDGTDEEFISLSQQAEKIESYCIENFGSDIFAVCGLSMGGAVAHLIHSRGKLKIKNVVMDGAPLVCAGAFACNAMKSSYKDILKGSKARDKKTLENFKKHFLPEKFLPDYLEFIDHTSERSIENIVDSVFSGVFDKNIKSDAKVLYMHGTKINEMYSKKTAKLIAKHYPHWTVVCFKGNAHCQCAIYEPDDWCAIVKDFFENR